MRRALALMVFVVLGLPSAHADDEAPPERLTLEQAADAVLEASRLTEGLPEALDSVVRVRLAHGRGMALGRACRGGTAEGASARTQPGEVGASPLLGGVGTVGVAVSGTRG